MINFDDFEYEEEGDVPFRVGDIFGGGTYKVTYWDQYLGEWIYMVLVMGDKDRVKKISKMSKAKIEIDYDEKTIDIPDNYEGVDEYVVQIGNYWPWMILKSLTKNKRKRKPRR